MKNEPKVQPPCRCVCYRCIANEPDHGACQHSCALRERKTVYRAVDEDKIERTEVDGAVHVQRDPAGTISIRVVSHGQEMLIRCSEWNARRALGSLSLILGLPLSTKAAKSIEM